MFFSVVMMGIWVVWSVGMILFVSIRRRVMVVLMSRVVGFMLKFGRKLLVLNLVIL